MIYPHLDRLLEPSDRFLKNGVNDRTHKEFPLQILLSLETHIRILHDVLKFCLNELMQNACPISLG